MAGLGRPYEIRPHARRLLALASGRWTPADIHRACEANGWAFEQDQSRTKGFSFRIDRDLRLTAVFEPFPSAPAPHCHVLLYLHAPANYPGRKFGPDAWEDFDRAFEASFDSLEADLGEAEAYGIRESRFDVEPRFAYAIWREGSGLLALQQEEYDLYCGEFAVSVYLHPWDEGRPAPRSPLAVCGRT
jgi:hypothetical protein